MTFCVFSKFRNYILCLFCCQMDPGQEVAVPRPPPVHRLLYEGDKEEMRAEVVGAPADVAADVVERAKEVAVPGDGRHGCPPST